MDDKYRINGRKVDLYSNIGKFVYLCKRFGCDCIGYRKVLFLFVYY